MDVGQHLSGDMSVRRGRKPRRWGCTGYAIGLYLLASQQCVGPRAGAEGWSAEKLTHGHGKGIVSLLDYEWSGAAAPPASRAVSSVRTTTDTPTARSSGINPSEPSALPTARPYGEARRAEGSPRLDSHRPVTKPQVVRKTAHLCTRRTCIWIGLNVAQCHNGGLPS
jgi:hypothetical protein